MIEAYPVPGVQGRRMFHAGLLELPGWHMWLGMLDGEPIGTAAAHVTDTLVDIEWISTMPSARGKRVGEALTWAATLAAPDRPAMLIASDLGQPVYERMGYLRLSRFTLWIGTRRCARPRVTSADELDVLRLFTLATRAHVELDALALFEGPVAIALDRREVDEDVVLALPRDEAEALLSVEPLHGARRHVGRSLAVLREHR